MSKALMVREYFDLQLTMVGPAPDTVMTLKATVKVNSETPLEFTVEEHTYRLRIDEVPNDRT